MKKRAENQNHGADWSAHARAIASRGPPGSKVLPCPPRLQPPPAAKICILPHGSAPSDSVEGDPGTRIGQNEVAVCLRPSEARPVVCTRWGKVLSCSGYEG
ncbi:hypothetical protein UPYG_G00090490 [Umbra pygmaea]|uniref:Uncharacterized protein n=1 Tax=Umbra pygmaea TaxID=75934 RepID=A0ABD0XUU8_UMBPY